MDTSIRKTTFLGVIATAALLLLVFSVRNRESSAQQNHSLQARFANADDCKNNCKKLLKSGRFNVGQENPCFKFCETQPLVELQHPPTCYSKCNQLCVKNWPSGDCEYDCALVCDYDPYQGHPPAPSINGYWRSGDDSESIWRLQTDSDSPTTFRSVALSPQAALSVSDVRGTIDQTGRSGTIRLTSAAGEIASYDWSVSAKGALDIRGDALCIRYKVVTGNSDPQNGEVYIEQTELDQVMNTPVVQAEVSDDGAGSLIVSPQMNAKLSGSWDMTMKTGGNREYKCLIERADGAGNLYKMKIEANWSKKFIKDFELRFTGENEGVMTSVYHSGRVDTPFIFDSPTLRFFNPDGSLRAVGVKHHVNHL